MVLSPTLSFFPCISTTPSMAKHRPPINTNWGIDTTAKGVIKLGTELWAASKSDNMHPSVVEACKLYGSTLPLMCPETSELVRLQARRTDSYRSERLKISIGYTPNDVAGYLASDDYGRR